jgi:hypothetical protein
MVGDQAGDRAGAQECLAQTMTSLRMPLKASRADFPRCSISVKRDLVAFAQPLGGIADFALAILKPLISSDRVTRSASMMFVPTAGSCGDCVRSILLRTTSRWREVFGRFDLAEVQTTHTLATASVGKGMRASE